MEKEEAKNYLMKKGYAVEMRNGIIMVLSADKDVKKLSNEIEKVLKEKGYNSSFGVVTGVNGMHHNNPVEITETEEEDDFREEEDDAESIDFSEDESEDNSFNENENGQLTLF